MATKNWSDEQVALIERLEKLLFQDDVVQVRLAGGGPVTARGRRGVSAEIEPELVIPEAMLRDLVNELLLPYAERKPQPKGSKSGNPAKRAAENKALGLAEPQVTRVKGTTTELAATLNLPHSTEKGRSLRVNLQTQWPPMVQAASLIFTKLAA